MQKKCKNLLFDTDSFFVEKQPRQRRKKKIKEKKNQIQLSLFPDFVPRQLKLDFNLPLTIPNVEPDKIVSKKQQKMKKTPIQYIEIAIREGTIPLMVFGGIGICIGIFDYATMVRNLPTHFNKTVALVFGILIGFAPTLLLVLRQYKSLSVVTLLMAMDIALGGVKSEEYNWVIWVYFALQISFLSWKINVYIAKTQGDENGNPVELNFFDNIGGGVIANKWNKTL